MRTSVGSVSPLSEPECIVQQGPPEISLWDCDCKACYILKREADDFLGENTVPRKYSDYLAGLR